MILFMQAKSDHVVVWGVVDLDTHVPPRGNSVSREMGRGRGETGEGKRLGFGGG
jgi:hypothetical protein